MSSLIYGATTEGTVSLSAATAKTVIQLRGSTTTKARIVAWGISFDGVTANAVPVLVNVRRQTTTGTLSTATAAKFDADDPAASLTAHRNATVEPTQSDILETYHVHPQGGLFVREYPPGREPVFDDATTSRIGIVATAPATVNCVAWIQWAE